MAKTPRLVKTLALAIVVAAIIASSGMVSALDATTPRLSGTASASASVSAASTPAPTTEGNSQAVMIEPAGDAPGALTAQNTLRDGAITRVDIAPPQAIPTQPNPSQPVFTITNTDTQTVTVWITHEGTNVDTKTETDANAGSAGLQYRDAETGERLSGSDVTVTLEPGEERIVGVVADDSASASASISGAGTGTEATSSTITATAHVHIRQTG
jgi:hypothetical protein